MIDIIVVDEAVHEIRPIISELLARGMLVETYKSADECLRNLCREQPPRVFVLDVMLASETSFSFAETNGFLHTGLLLARRIRAVHPRVPIVFFTAASLDTLKSLVHDVSRELDNCLVVRKSDISRGSDFAHLIEPIVRSGRVPRQGGGLVGALFDSISLQPSIGGVI